VGLEVHNRPLPNGIGVFDSKGEIRVAIYGRHVTYQHGLLRRASTGTELSLQPTLQGVRQGFSRPGQEAVERNVDDLEIYLVRAVVWAQFGGALERVAAMPPQWSGRRPL
jgi:hypothetical protein